MVTFGLGDYKTEFDDWARHHKEISIQVKREYIEGNKEDKEVTEQVLEKVIKDNEDKILKHKVSVFNTGTGESYDVLDWYLPLKNLDYKERDVEHYGIGAVNTGHVTKLRLIFKIEYVDFILDYEYETEGTHATSFHSLLEGIDSIEGIIEDVIEGERKEFKDIGIETGKEDDYYIVGVNEFKRPVEFEIDSRELMNSLIAIEVYEHTTTINNK